MTAAGRGRPAHWADLLAARFEVPDRERLIEARLARIADTVEPEIVDLIRQAKGELPLPPLEERVEAERRRLPGMSTAAIAAEQRADERELEEMLEQARRISAAQERWMVSGCQGPFPGAAMIVDGVVEVSR